MAQTASAITFKDCQVWYSTDGSTTWTDCSGFASEVAVTGGERVTGEAYTFDGDTAIIGQAKRGPLSITATMVYTEGATDPTGVLRDYYTAGSSIALRWSPRGLVAGLTGENVYTSAFTYARIKNLGYPAGAANSGDPLVVALDIVTPSITKTTSGA